jgi:hypothetical protein
MINRSFKFRCGRDLFSQSGKIDSGIKTEVKINN